MRKDEFAVVLGNLVRNISYPNFKDKVTEVQGYQRSRLYENVWSELYNAEKKIGIQSSKLATAAAALNVCDTCGHEVDYRADDARRR